MTKLATLAVCLGCALPSIAHAEPTDAEVSERLAFIEKRLDAGNAAANRWSYGWFATYGTLSVAQFGVGLGVKNRKTQIDMAVGSVSSSFGILPFALFPFTPRLAAGELAAWPESTPEERRSKLARGEALLKKSADAEHFGHSWVPLVLGSSVSVGFGLVRALVYNRINTGIMSTVIGIGLVETQIFSQPTTAIDDWDDYRKGNLHGARSSRGPSITIVPAPGGVGVAGAF